MECQIGGEIVVKMLVLARLIICNKVSVRLDAF